MPKWDYVIVYTVDKRKLEFEVVRVEDNALVGEQETVARADIARLEVKRVHAGRTTFAGAGSVLGVLGAALLIFAF